MKATTLVNQLAELRAAIADLKEQEDAIKAKILATGETVIESDMFRLTVSVQAGRKVTNWSAVKDQLWENMEFQRVFRENTKTGPGATVIRLSARKQVAA